MEILCSHNSGEGLYHLYPNIQTCYGVRVSRQKWHKRLEHPSDAVLQNLSSVLLIKESLEKWSVCPICPLGKALSYHALGKNV